MVGKLQHKANSLDMVVGFLHGNCTRLSEEDKIELWVSDSPWMEPVKYK